MSMIRHAVVTGASSGIGAATVHALVDAGWTVTAVARRRDRLDELAESTGARPVVADVTDDDHIRRLITELADQPIHALVNNAGAAHGFDSIAEGDLGQWARMYEVNVLGSVRVTQALLPMIRRTGRGSVVMVTSTAAESAYEGGGGYLVSKAAMRAMTGVLRLEEAEHGVRVIEITPGMVRTPEFTLNRLEGDVEAYEDFYRGVPHPLQAEDVARAIVFVLDSPAHVNIDRLVMRPLAQAANHKIVETGLLHEWVTGF